MNESINLFVLKNAQRKWPQIYQVNQSITVELGWPSNRVIPNYIWWDVLFLSFSKQRKPYSDEIFGWLLPSDAWLSIGVLCQLSGLHSRESNIYFIPEEVYFSLSEYVLLSRLLQFTFVYTQSINQPINQYLIKNVKI